MLAIGLTLSILAMGAELISINDRGMMYAVMEIMIASLKK